MATLFAASSALTVRSKAVPDWAVDGAETEKCVAGPALTSIEEHVPVIDAIAVSVAVIVWLPAVRSVAEKLPVPFVSVEFAGSTACPSVLEKCTVPE